MGAIVGLTIHRNLSFERNQSLLEAQHQTLSLFEWFDKKSPTVSKMRLSLWGRREVLDRVHNLPDGSVVLIGSTHNKISWQSMEANLLGAKTAGDFQLSWEGHVILLHVSAHSTCWTMWNDWLGGIPVFHAQIGGGSVASALKPVTVAAAGYIPDDFFMPDLISVLINGRFISDWTLYKGLKTVPADSWSGTKMAFARNSYGPDEFFGRFEG